MADIAATTDLLAGAATSSQDVAEGVKVCRSCGASNAPDADSCAVCRKFVRGTQSARKAGIYAQHQTAELRRHVEVFGAGVVSDLGNDELSTIERGYVDKLGELEGLVRLLALDIAQRGLLTPAGGVRRSFEQLLAGLDRWDRFAQRLGMRRRARKIESAADIIASFKSREDPR